MRYTRLAAPVVSCWDRAYYLLEEKFIEGSESF